MFRKRIRNILNMHKSIIKYDADAIGIYKLLCPWVASYSTGLSTDLPRKLKKSERKPWVTSVNELKRQARYEKKDRQLVRETTLSPPQNGLLVKGLVSVAHEVFAARAELYSCVSTVAAGIPIYSCSLCGEVHVGHPPHKIKTCDVAGNHREHTWVRGDSGNILPNVESFHLYDRIGRAVSHKERLQVDCIPAIVELCIQAGVNVPEYPTRRREFPVYRVAGRLIDFEQRFPKDDLTGKDIQVFGFWENKKKIDAVKYPKLPHAVQDLAVQGMEAWGKLRSGAIELMKTYPVQTCGYCSEVQVGPKGHRVRQCQAFKHQMRDGQHAWQEATVDDLVPPVYVWHAQEFQSGEHLVDELKRYYGKLPAVVKLFALAGAHVGETYTDVMRGDVVVPELSEAKLVV